jgi:SPP1 gp7 family putative phage head morphogenesis protein
MRSLTLDAKKTIKGKFKPSSTAERDFYRQLKKVAQASGHIVDQHVDGVEISDPVKLQSELKRYSEKLTPWAQKQAAKMLQQVQKSNKRAYTNKSKAIGAALQLNVAEKPVGEIALKLLNEQVALIKSIPIEAGLRAQKIALEAFYQGTRAEANADTIAELQKQLGLTTEVATSRALLIARTETARANAAINQSRAVAVGSNQYRWHNSGDGAVRESHRIYKGKKMQGQIFSWDQPPTLSDGMTGHPGSFPNCRCFAEPVFDDE